jgi:hypothetical protein
MAIQFNIGTINQPDAASVGFVMSEQIRDDIVAHPAWDLVEEYTASGGACRWYVFKCLASVSGLSSDFFVVICRNISTGELRCFVCEEYTLATHTAAKYCPAGGSTAYDALGRKSETFVLGTAFLTGSPATNPNWLAWIPSGTSVKYWTAVSEDGFSVAFNGTANGYFHVGAYTPLCLAPISLPLQMIGHSQPSGQGLITRNPAMAGVSAAINALFIDGGQGNNDPPPGRFLGFRGDLKYSDKLQSNQRIVAEMGMILNPSAGNPDVVGSALGKQRRMRIGSFPPTGLSFGDAYAMEGRLWIPYLPTDTRLWDTGVTA